MLMFDEDCNYMKIYWNTCFCRPLLKLKCTLMIVYFTIIVQNTPNHNIPVAFGELESHHQVVSQQMH